MTATLALLFLLLFGHAVADWGLQPGELSRAKRSFLPEGAGLPWVWALSMHSMIHAGFVFLFTFSLLLGVLEFVTHWLTDLAKCHGRIGLKTDQAIHVGCKVAWVALIIMGVA